MEQEGSTLKAFWDRGTTPETCADLASFIKTFDGNPSMQLAMVEVDGQIAGFLWLSEIIIGHQAFISIWMRKEYRQYAEAASRLVIQQAFDTYQLTQLWVLTPWQRAKALAVRTGFTQVGTMPGFCRIVDTSYDVHILRLTKEQWNGKGSHTSSR